MISLLTSLKPFTGDAIRLQEYALSNWRRLHPNLEIILYGEGEGISECAYRYGAKHVTNIRCNPKGIPDFAAIVEHAALHAKYDTQVYLNGDILLPPDFVQQVNNVSLDQYLIIGQRIDLDKNAVFNHLATAWNEEIKKSLLLGHALLHNPAAQDYFVFPRGLWQGLSPLIIGRGGYDNALIAFCLRRKIHIIDATFSIHAVHQWHDYSHVKGKNETFSGDDALANARLHDIVHSNPDIEDANSLLIGGEIIFHRRSVNLLRRLEVFLRYRLGFKYISYLCRFVIRIAWFAGTMKKKNCIT